MSNLEIKNDLICPKCGGDKFQFGPRGGNAVNVRCKCGYVLNVARLFDGRFWVEEIGYYNPPHLEGE